MNKPIKHLSKSKLLTLAEAINFIEDYQESDDEMHIIINDDIDDDTSVIDAIDKECTELFQIIGYLNKRRKEKIDRLMHLISQSDKG